MKIQVLEPTATDPDTTGKPPAQQQDKVNDFFTSAAPYWDAVYSRADIEGQIYRDRLAAVLDWIDGMNLPAGSRVLEVGCGAGLLTRELVERGYQVQAIDSVQAMIDRARDTVGRDQAGTLTIDLGDMQHLRFDSASFDLALAVGVLPWIPDQLQGLKELARVTVPDGRVIVTADNRMRLNFLLDPWLHPAAIPLKRAVKRLLEALGVREYRSEEVEGRFCRRDETRRLLRAAGFRIVTERTEGFGPFTLFGHRPLPMRLSLEIQRRLSRLAERGFPVIASTGSHHLLLAEREA